MENRNHFSRRIASQPPFGKIQTSYLNLSSNELQHPSFPQLFRRFLEQYALTTDFSHYPALEAGANMLETAIGAHQNSVVLTPGADLGIRAIIEAIGASNCLLAATPCYRAYQEYAAAFGLRFFGINLLRTSEDEFIAKMTNAIVTNAPCLVSIANPDGVTGRLWTHAAISEILIVCERCHSILILDEAYASFSAPSPMLFERPEHCVRLKTFSKSHGAAGIRLAYIEAAPEIARQIAKTRVSNGISSFAISYLNFILQEKAEFYRIVSDIILWRERAENTLRSLYPYWDVPRSHANFIFFDTHCGSTINKLGLRLDKQGIRIRLFSSESDFTTCARATIAEPAIMDRLIACIPREN
ncbi:aminotransferase class I/II-fold pyridoxal phosphate-dependent enzyme [Pseudomonas sp. EA_65y_Pfl2_P74]|uniref:aminotransferase class I/II-fold pyridoxal phosphate-dependent enzyme n=1 Tax=Pseudomonas sp. EA_65y_Pfl2_P74 TaxID=3088694 RepID=UPI0030D7672C